MRGGGGGGGGNKNYDTAGPNDRDVYPGPDGKYFFL